MSRVTRLGAVLVGPSLRAAASRVPLAFGVAGLVLDAVIALQGARLGTEALIRLLRFVALAGAAGTAFLLDDEAGALTATLPVTRRFRYGVLLLAALPGLALWWVIVVGVGRRAGDDDAARALPVAALTVEVAAMITVGLLVAVWPGRRRTDRQARGVVAACTVLGLVIGLEALSTWWPALPQGPAQPHWTVIHVGWAVAALGLAVMGVVVAGERQARATRTHRGRSPVVPCEDRRS